ncbi:MAG: malto-oligosyltrehalose synthase, partial [Acidobacteria bacterium]|nr:malto-oligosyltrehalose synthase [Acidobacteriota bacterium]
MQTPQRLTSPQLMHSVRATYRLQFTPAFTFADAVALVPALAALGVSHLYASPVFEAVRGSLHGYDVIDPARVRAVFGGDDGWRALAAAADAHGMGLIADIVPNHMALPGNPWWTDLLEHGPRSRYASYFDVRVPDDDTTTVLIPLLGEPYGEELERGRLTLVSDDGTIRLAYGDERLPLSPESLAPLLAAGGGPAAVVARLNADRAALHELLEAQHYRLTWWRLARDETPYRRFFDINGLVGVRVELEDVFAAVHALPLAWVRDGLVDGLRIDHVDGLADPTAYLRRLRAVAPTAWLGVEKILAEGEALPDWPVDGTTGYEFGALVTRLFTAPEAEAPLTAFHAQFTGSDEPYDDIAREARHEMVTHWLLGDVEQAAGLLYERCQADVALRDYSQRECLTVVQEVVAQRPVYRTYVDAAGASPRDAALLDAIFAGVRANRADLPEGLVAFAAQLCLQPGDDLAFVARVQQLSTAVAAKALEDTAFYRDTRFIALNDVGGDPARFSVTVADFHQTMARWQLEQPRGLRATSTHDAKRAEDVRARLTVLSEATAAWAYQVAAWSGQAEPWRRDGQPDRSVEYYLYQTLAGAWPVSRERAHTHALKAAREAKRFTNWTTPAPSYEDALRQFVDRLYD